MEPGRFVLSLKRSAPDLFLRKRRKILFYALGTGLGHLSRSHAIIRKMASFNKGEIILLTNSPHSSLYCQEKITTLFIDTSHGSPSIHRKKITLLIEAISPAVLVVDAFPRGIGGELPSLLARKSYRKVFVRRILRADYVRRFSIDEFVGAHFDSVIHAEPLHPSQPYPVHLCCPLLLRDFDELPERKEARLLLKVAGKQTVVLTAASETSSAQNFRRLVEKIMQGHRGGDFLLRHAVLPTEGSQNISNSAVPHFPLIEALPGVDILIASSGYNLFHESQALKLPTLFIPQIRAYDDQSQRAGSLSVSSPEELEARLQILMAHARALTPEPYINAAGKAAQIIAGLS